jgi:redox-sensing transcriptional repressor
MSPAVQRSIPPATVERLPLYLRCLEELPASMERISSADLAALADVTPAKVRKDLSTLGSYGVRGVGYSAERLRFQIRLALGLTREWGVVVIGAGNLGRALAGYGGFGESGFAVVGLFDVAPDIVGSEVGGLIVEPVRRLSAVVRATGAVIGVIATPGPAAQDAADRLADAGIRSILNFAPTVIRVPEGAEVRQVDLATEFQVLSFYLHREDDAGAQSSGDSSAVSDS